MEAGGKRKRWLKKVEEEEGEEFPQKRHAHSIVVHQDGKSASLYLFGGYTDDGLCAPDLWRYNFRSGRWSIVEVKKGNPPSRRHSHTAILSGDSIIFFGGADEKGELDSSLYVFSIKQGSWKKMNTKGESPEGRWGHSAVLNGSTMWIFAGFAKSGYSNQLFSLDLNRWRWSEMKDMEGDVPSARHLHSAVHSSGRMIIFGGYSSTNHCDLSLYHYKENRWEMISKEVELERRGHIAVMLGEDVMAIHGGRSKAGPLNDIHIWSFETNGWERIESDEEDENNLPTARYFHSAAVVQGTVWIFGGLGIPQGSKETKPKNLNDFYQFALDGHFLAQDDDEQEEKEKHKPKKKGKGSNSDSNVDFLAALPPEISVHILSFLPVSSVCSVSLVSRQWHSIAEEATVWQILYMRDFKHLEADSKNWKQQYKVAVAIPDAFTPLPPNMNLARQEFKMIALGDGGVGKTALTLQFMGQRFREEYDPTIEDSHKKLINIDNSGVILLCVLDLAGPEEYPSLVRQTITAMEGFLLVFSLTDTHTLAAINMYYEQIRRSFEETPMPIVVAANKCDLPYDTEWLEEGRMWAKERRLPFIVTSAKLNINVTEAFYGVARAMVRRHARGRNTLAPSTPKGRCIVS